MIKNTWCLLSMKYILVNITLSCEHWFIASNGFSVNFSFLMLVLTVLLSTATTNAFSCNVFCFIFIIDMFYHVLSVNKHFSFTNFYSPLDQCVFLLPCFVLITLLIIVYVSTLLLLCNIVSSCPQVSPVSSKNVLVAIKALRGLQLILLRVRLVSRSMRHAKKIFLPTLAKAICRRNAPQQQGERDGFPPTRCPVLLMVQ